MALEQRDIEFIKENLGKWLLEISQKTPLPFHDVELRERLVRFEEELKAQRELLGHFMEMTNRRFEELREDMNRRFEAVDKRFEAMDKRFEELSRRIDRFMFWSFSLTVTVGGLIVAAIKLL